MNWRATMMAAVTVFLASAMAFAQGRGMGGPGGPGGAQGDRQGPRGDGQGGGRGMGMRGEGGMEAQLKGVLDQLNLTDDQKQKLDQIKGDFDKKTADQREKMRTGMEEVRKYRDANPDDREGMRKKMQDAMGDGAGLRDAYQGYVTEVKGVLNEEQLKKFNELMPQGGMAGGPAGAAGQRMAAGLVGLAFLGLDMQTMQDLKLTPEQQDKVKGLAQTYAEELKQLQTKYQGLVKEQLTPDQQAVFEKAVQESQARMRDRMMGGGPGGDRPGRGDRPAGGKRGGRGGPEGQNGPGGDVPPPPPPRDEQEPK